ncbi:hypothetical protein HDU81_000655 [Chytriomyces hyalinus]|nr:hypothetical protein HDU81_000655 [Chytriomyces hyalinus]
MGALSVRASKIHVHIPGLVVHAECARAFLAVVKNIIESDPIRSELLSSLGTDTFDNVFDGSVYSSGLRMLGSLKLAAKDKDPSWVTDKFYQAVDECFEVFDLTLDDDEDDFLDVVQDCSIFNLAGDKVTRIAAPAALDSSSAEATPTGPPNSEGDYGLLTNQDHLDVLKAGLGTVLMYRPDEILSFKKYAKSVVVELDDTYFPGLKRKHSSNRVYLVISATAVSKKCSSPQCASNPASTVKTAITVFPT